jgi:Na+/phosphate symporter
MTISIYLSLLVAIVGGLFYLLSAHPKRSELGRIAFFAGLFVFLLLYGSHPISILPTR